MYTCNNKSHIYLPEKVMALKDIKTHIRKKAFIV